MNYQRLKDLLDLYDYPAILFWSWNATYFQLRGQVDLKDSTIRISKPSAEWTKVGSTILIGFETKEKLEGCQYFREYGQTAISYFKL